MVSPMLILTLAWTLSGMTSLLGAKYFVADLLNGNAAALQYLLPGLIFLVAVFLAFATGTSWGTFSILVPIVCHAFPQGEMLVVSIAACLSGAVCGDHCSPISDTTIMASAGAHCSHVNHVATQLPYAATTAAVAAAGYLLTGLVHAVLGQRANLITSLVLLGVTLVLELVVLSALRAYLNKRSRTSLIPGAWRCHITLFSAAVAAARPDTNKRREHRLCWNKPSMRCIPNSSCIFIRTYSSVLPPVRQP